ncbi:MAG: ABC transporter permease [Acidimicrobiia bacterium]
MSDRRTPAPALVWRQIRYQNTMFWRSPVAAFFTLIFPLMFLILFNLLFDDRIEIEGRDPLTIVQFYAPALAAFAAASATYTNIGVSQAINRDERILKRFRSTPLPPWIYMAGVVGSAIWLALIATVLMISVGVVAYGLEIYVDRLPAAVFTLAVGVTAFAALGLALAAISPTGDTAPAVANATLLPVAFISNVFIPIQDPAPWLEFLGDFFPLKHFVVPLQDAFNPFVTDSAFRGGDLLVMAIWGVAGLAYALKFFAWEPKSEGGTRRRRGRTKTPA